MLRLVPCGCGTQYLVRIERSWWMRAFAWRRLYFCTQCRARLFIRKPVPAAPWSIGGSIPPPAQPGDEPAQPQLLAGETASARD